MDLDHGQKRILAAMPPTGELTATEINFVAWDSFAEHTHLVRQLEGLAEAGLVEGVRDGVEPRRWSLTYAGAAARDLVLNP